MKKIVSIFAFAVIFTACKSKTSTDPDNKNMVLVDTTGLSKSNALTDVGGKYVINDKATTEKNNATKSHGNSEVNNNASNSGSAGANAPAPAPAPIPRDKGWSHAAKGTAVGAGTGAITGAILNKDHRGTGAIIGAVIGAGTGYVIGRSTDKKTGRVARAKARKAANQ